MFGMIIDRLVCVRACVRGNECAEMTIYIHGCWKRTDLARYSEAPVVLGVLIGSSKVCTCFAAENENLLLLSEPVSFISSPNGLSGSINAIYKTRPLCHDIKELTVWLCPLSHLSSVPHTTISEIVLTPCHPTDLASFLFIFCIPFFPFLTRKIVSSLLFSFVRSIVSHLLSLFLCVNKFRIYIYACAYVYMCIFRVLTNLILACFHATRIYIKLALFLVVSW